MEKPDDAFAAYLTAEQTIADGRRLERRTEIVIEGRPLLTGNADDPLEFPDDYVRSAVAEAQHALRGVEGAKRAMIVVTIRVQPFCTPLRDE